MMVKSRESLEYYVQFAVGAKTNQDLGIASNSCLKEREWTVAKLPFFL